MKGAIPISFISCLLVSGSSDSGVRLSGGVKGHGVISSGLWSFTSILYLVLS